MTAMRTRRPDDAAFYGRRKGKTIRSNHLGLLGEMLPSLRLDLSEAQELSGCFPHHPELIELEIGFGGGEHLAHRAALYPDRGFIGCEAFVNGVAKLLQHIEDAHLTNIRIFDDDAAKLIDSLPGGSISRVHLLYPDPWPKRKHRKRRFLAGTMLMRLARIMVPGGELRVATDIDDYVAFVLHAVQNFPDLEWTATRARDWLEPWADWTRTRYEAKAIHAGRVPTYLTFCKR